MDKARQRRLDARQRRRESLENAFATSEKDSPKQKQHSEKIVIQKKPEQSIRHFQEQVNREIREAKSNATGRNKGR